MERPNQVPIPEVKKNLINDRENIIVYREESEWSETSVKKDGLFQKQPGGYGGGSNATPGRLCNFYQI